MVAQEKRFMAYRTSSGHLLMESNEFGWDFTLIDDGFRKIDDGIMMTGEMPAKTVARNICKNKLLRAFEEEDYNEILKMHLLQLE